MDVRKSLARAVSKRWPDDGVVVPSNIKQKVFTTCAIDNIDESGRYEFHGTALTLTSHLTNDNVGEDPPPLTLEFPEDILIKLPDYYANVPHIEEYAGDITLPNSGNGGETEDEAENLRSRVPEEALLKHLNKTLIEKD